MTEAEFTRDVCGMADSLGLLWHHCPDSRRCKGNAGFPDILAAGPGGLLFAELKSEDGETSPGQDYWQWIITEAAGPLHSGRLRARVYRPSHLEHGTIETALRQLR